MSKNKKTFGNSLFTLAVEDERFLDKTTYVVCFQDLETYDGDKHHVESEFHLDEDKFTHTDVFEHETLHINLPLDVKREIEDYILKKVGLVSHRVERISMPLMLTLDIKEGTTIGDMAEFKRGIDISGLAFPQHPQIECISAKLDHFNTKKVL